MLDRDPRDFDSRDDERHSQTPRRGGRGSSGDHERDHDARQPDTRTRDRDDGDERSLGRGPETTSKGQMPGDETAITIPAGPTATATGATAIPRSGTRSRATFTCHADAIASWFTIEKRLLDAALAMNTWEHKCVGPLIHDRIIGALELCCRLGEMLVIHNKRVDWDTHTIGIPGQTRERAADAALSERHRRGAAERAGGQLEAADAEGSRGRPQCVTECHTVSHGPSKSGAPGRTRTCDPRLRRPWV
jgi:hypothetical protein